MVVRSPTLNYHTDFGNKIFKSIIFLNENCFILNKIQLKFNWKKKQSNSGSKNYQTGNKPLSEPIMDKLTVTFLCHSTSMS